MKIQNSRRPIITKTFQSNSHEGVCLQSNTFFKDIKHDFLAMSFATRQKQVDGILITLYILAITYLEG